MTECAVYKTNTLLLEENLCRAEVQLRLQRLAFQKKALKVHIRPQLAFNSRIYTYISFAYSEKVRVSCLNVSAEQTERRRTADKN